MPKTEIPPDLPFGPALDKATLQELCRENSFQLHYLEAIPLQESASSEPSQAIALEHASGAEIYIMACESEESAFSYCFATPPSDDKGLPHIVEHSVFCGSKNYPLKEPFANLQKTSVCSFLNALTYPDQTLYPAASAFSVDFMQLLRVYGDAVFFPLFEECAIAQEGVRQNPVSHNGHNSQDAQFEGIVYNEMQGYYADFDSYVADQSLRNIFPREEQHPNSFDAGGDPQAMRSLDLDYSEVRDFHKRYYRPENCRIVLYGSIPKQNLAEILRYLDAELLNDSGDSKSDTKAHRSQGQRQAQTQRKTDNADACSARLLVKASSSPKPSLRQPNLPKTLRNTLARKRNQNSQRSVVLLWLLPPQHNARITLQYRLLAELLLGHSASILVLPAMASKMGADLCMGSNLELGLQQPILRIGLSAYQPADAEPFRQLLWRALEDFRSALARGDSGLEHLWQGALNSLEYEELALGEHGGEEGLCALERCLQMAKASHFYRDAALQNFGTLATKKADLAERIFAPTLPILQELRCAGLAAFAKEIFEHTLDNPNWCLNLFESIDAEQEAVEAAEDGRQADEGLSARPQADSIERLHDDFAEYQKRQDAPELTAKIKALQRHDLGQLKPEPICDFSSSESLDHSGRRIDFVCHDAVNYAMGDLPVPDQIKEANRKKAEELHSLVCLDCYWDISDWPEARELLMPTFLDLVNEMGLPGQAYPEVSQRLSLHFGAWDTSIVAQKMLGQQRSEAQDLSKKGQKSDINQDKNPIKKFVCMHLSFLPREWEAGLELFWDLLANCDWHDEKRLHELLKSRYYEKAQDLCSSPTTYAIRRASLALSQSLPSETMQQADNVSSVARFEENCHGLSQVELLKIISQQNNLVQVIETFEKLQQHLLSSPLSCAIYSSQNQKVQDKFKELFLRPNISKVPKMPNISSELPQCICQATQNLTAEFFSSRTKLNTKQGAENRQSAKKQGIELWEGHLALENLAIAIPSQEWGDRLHPAFCVLARLLRSGPAWESIRLQQGAYGVQVQQESPYFILATSQDSDARKSIQLFCEALEQMKAQIAASAAQQRPAEQIEEKRAACFAQEFEAAIVQEMAVRLKAPSASERAALVLRHRLIGLEHSDLAAWLERLQQLEANDVLQAIDFLLYHWQHKSVCIFAETQRMEAAESKESPDMEKQSLPCFTEE